MSESAPSSVDATHAWSLLPRCDPPKRPAAERIADFREIYGCYDEAMVREQAARCIVCTDPACVTGCPLASPIAEWMALTAAGEFRAAAEVLQSTSCLPEISARTCPADQLCEALCVLKGRAEPISIWGIEQFLHHYSTFAGGSAGIHDAPANGRHVAILGASPGGLACADELVRAGCRVSILEPGPSPEDSLLHGIPGFRIDRSLGLRRIENFRERGVVFRTGRAIADAAAFDALRSEVDAIYLAWPARVARRLAVPGTQLNGVLPALPFIRSKNEAEPRSNLPIDLVGRRVVVVGGGDTALDCARTAVRCGAAGVTCVYRRDRASMPASRRRYENALEEGVKFVFEAAPVEMFGTREAGVTVLRLVRTKSGGSDQDGRLSFSPEPGTEFSLAADLVFLALGFEPARPAADSPFRGVAMDDGGRMIVNESMMTSMSGVFAGGDLVRGPTPTIHAVRDGQRAAEGICEYIARRSRLV